MKNYTPGPWNIHPHYTDPKLFAVYSGPQPFVACSTYVAQGEKIIAEVDMKLGVSGGYPCVTSREEMMANARLISSAPDLLAALVEIMPFVEEDYFESCALPPFKLAVEQARSAISKAKGSP